MHHCGGVDDDLNEIMKAATGERSVRAIALRVGMEPSTLTRQLRADLPVQTAVAIARAYGVPVVPLFVEVGYITGDEAREGVLAMALEQASDAELMTETLRRVQAGKASRVITAPIDVSGLSDDELRSMDVSDLALAAGDDDTVDSEDDTTP